jgi:hypothetical protein
MRHMLRFDGNKYRPMLQGKVTQGHVTEKSCWCRPLLMKPVADGIPVYLHIEQEAKTGEHAGPISRAKCADGVTECPTGSFSGLAFGAK